MKRAFHIENPRPIEEFMRSLIRQKPKHENQSYRFMVQAAHVQACIEAFDSYRSQIAGLKRQIADAQPLVVTPTKRTARNTYATEVA